jgi:polysaccharide biosynthesis/export protein
VGKENMVNWCRFGLLFVWLMWGSGVQAQLSMSYGLSLPASTSVASGSQVSNQVANPVSPAPSSINQQMIPGMPVGAASAAAATGASTPMATLASLSADYRIGSNDLMDIEVFGVPELKRTVRVNSSGHVTLPLIGNVMLAGMTGQQAESAIAVKYAERHLQNPEVSVFIREFTTQRITIEGAVGRPGIYPVTGQVTLLRALALAGGGGQYAELGKIKIFRAGNKSSENEQIYDIDKIRAGEMSDPVIQADDVIVVPRNPARTALRDSLFRDVLDSINPFSVLAPSK